MSRVAQAFDSLPASLFGSASRKAGVLAAMLALCGCGAGGFSLSQADVDRSVVTSSLEPGSPSDDSGWTADQATIRDAVSSADIEMLAGKELAWANSATGSRGTITGLKESRNSGRLCRSFVATRESYDGVALFKGKACTVNEGTWRIEGFAAAPDSAGPASAGTGISS